MTPPPIETEFLRWREAGEPDALAAVFDRLAPELLLVAAHFADARHDAEDLVQETFLAAIDHSADWDRDRPLRPWLVGILANRARRLRQERARQPDPERMVFAESEDPADRLLANEIAERVTRAIAGLPPLYREALTLNTVHGLTPTQIAQAAGISPNTVKTRLHRARQLLESALPKVLASGLALLALPASGLAAVRDAVLQHAGVVPTPPPVPLEASGAATSSGGGVAGLLGGLAAVLVLGVLGGAAWWLLQDPAAKPGAAVDVVTNTTATRNASTDELAPAPDVQAPERVAMPEFDGPPALRVLVRYPDGTPAADVAVRATPTATTLASLDERRARTDPTGVAELGTWSSAAVRVEADRGGEVAVTIAADGGGLGLLELPNARTVVGSVARADGTPLEAAEILVAAPGRYDDPLRATTTDAAGRFTLRGLGEDHLLCARAPGFTTSPLVAPPDDAPLAIVLDAPGLTVTGRVRDLDERPLPGARILVGLSFPPEALVDPEQALGRRPAEYLFAADDGSFRADSVPEQPEIIVWGRARGFAVRAGNVLLTPGKGADVNLGLERGATLQGRLLADDGGPAAGASLLIRDSQHDLPHLDVHPPRFARTHVHVGDDGRYAVEGLLPVELELRAASRDGEALAVTTLHPRPGEALTWDAQLARPIRLWGHVVDPLGAPLADLEIEAQVAEPWRPPAPVLTDASGRFEFETSTTEPHRLLVRAAGITWPGVLVTHDGASPEHSPLRIALARDHVPSASLTGVLTDAAGEAVDPAQYAIALWDEHWARGILRLDADSRFTAPRLPPGRYRLMLLRRDRKLAPHRADLEIIPGDPLDLGRIPFPEQTSAVVTLLDHTGAPVRDADVTAHLEDGFNVTSATTDAEGRARFVLPPGDYWLTDRECLPAADWSPTRLEAGTVTELRLVRAAKLHAKHFELRHADDGQDLRVCWTVTRDGIVVRRWTGFWKRGANPDQVLVRGFPTGTWHVEVIDHAGRRAATDFEIPAARDSTADDTAPTVLELR